jgi:hypothetical protein
MPMDWGLARDYSARDFHTEEAPVTEAEWLACTDFNLLWAGLAVRSTHRKRRLFAVACCRQLWHLLPDEPCRRVVDVAERYADGQAEPQELVTAHAAARAVVDFTRNWPPEKVARAGVVLACYSDEDQASAWAESVGNHETVGQTAPELWARLEVLREMVGNPFRTTAIDPAWLAWNGAAVRALAASIYDSRAFDRLPVLADALEDAGCTDAELLGHLRGPGPHVRGCWALDLITNRK